MPATVTASSTLIPASPTPSVTGTPIVLATSTPSSDAAVSLTEIHSRPKIVFGGRSTPCDLGRNLLSLEKGCLIVSSVSSVSAPGAHVQYVLVYPTYSGIGAVFTDTADARGHSLHVFNMPYLAAPRGWKGPAGWDTPGTGSWSKVGIVVQIVRPDGKSVSPAAAGYRKGYVAVVNPPVPAKIDVPRGGSVHVADQPGQLRPAWSWACSGDVSVRDTSGVLRRLYDNLSNTGLVVDIDGGILGSGRPSAASGVSVIAPYGASCIASTDFEAAAAVQKQAQETLAAGCVAGKGCARVDVVDLRYNGQPGVSRWYNQS
jgi:hypothetical protein